MRRKTDSPNWGGPGRGGGRPKEAQIIMVRIPLPMWQQFTESAPPDLSSEDMIYNLAASTMLDGISSYIRSKKHAEKKAAKENNEPAQ